MMTVFYREIKEIETSEEYRPIRQLVPEKGYEIPTCLMQHDADDKKRGYIRGYRS